MMASFSVEEGYLSAHAFTPTLVLAVDAFGSVLMEKVLSDQSCIEGLLTQEMLALLPSVPR